MPTRNVVITDHQQALIDELVGSGRYQNASEVLREGLRLVEQRDREDALRLERLRQEIEIGFRDVAEGRYVTVEADEIESFVAGLSPRAVSDRTALP